MSDKSLGDQNSEEETARRRDAALLRALKSPPKTHAEITGKNGKAEKKPTGKTRPAK